MSSRTILSKPRARYSPLRIWDRMREWASTKGFSSWVGDLVLPSQDVSIYGYNSPSGSNIEYPKVDTLDSITLDTIEIKTAKPSQRYIIFFPGNAMLYQHIFDQLVDLKNRLNCNVIGFNYRGVGKSSGEPDTHEDLVLDGIAQVNRLLEKGVPPQNILLHGLSLGGGIATLVAKHFHDQDRPIYLFNNRSFSNISNVFIGQLLGTQKDPLFSRIIRAPIIFFLYPIIKFAIEISGWEINAASAYRAIPNEYKCYITAENDNVITAWGGLHAKVRSDLRNNEKYGIFAPRSDEVDAHNLPEDHLYQGQVNAAQFLNQFVKEKLKPPLTKTQNTNLHRQIGPRKDSDYRLEKTFNQEVRLATSPHFKSPIATPRLNSLPEHQVINGQAPPSP